ncbi:hypothetical protein [Mesorhizobium marinum]|uniref:hypothetical protein n=1 Tax=Mesorhizobium marinum TaxID=3228790 RepID=UPI00346770B7
MLDKPAVAGSILPVFDGPFGCYRQPRPEQGSAALHRRKLSAVLFSQVVAIPNALRLRRQAKNGDASLRQCGVASVGGIWIETQPFSKPAAIAALGMSHLETNGAGTRLAAWSV